MSVFLWISRGSLYFYIQSTISATNYVCSYLNTIHRLVNTSPQIHKSVHCGVYLLCVLLVQSIVQIHVYSTPRARLIPICDTGGSPAPIALFDWSHPRIPGKVIPTISSCALVLAYTQCGRQWVFNWREEAVGAGQQIVARNPYIFAN